MSKKGKVEDMEGFSEEAQTVNPELNDENMNGAEEISEEEGLREELAKEKDKFLRLFAEFKKNKMANYML